MGAKLEEHKNKKAYKVQGFDIISTGLNIAGWLLLATSAMQPKNPVNIARLGLSFGLFSASVITERLRESDLLSLDRATDYEKVLIGDRLKLDAVITEELHKLEVAESVFAQVPIDRHMEIAQKIGVAPPNYAARQVDPIAQSLSQPQTQTVVEDEVDPTGDFDPESRSQEREDSGSRFILAENVDSWFQEIKKSGEYKPDAIEALMNEWEESGGIGIEVSDNRAFVIPQQKG